MKTLSKSGVRVTLEKEMLFRGTLWKREKMVHFVELSPHMIFTDSYILAGV